jgi:hypothetical protein
MEEYLDDADAGQRLALDMIDIVDCRGELALVIGKISVGVRTAARLPKMAIRIAITTKV